MTKSYMLNAKIVKKKNALYFISLVIFVSFFQQAMSQAAKGETTFTIENYYKAKWGYADEFINLWKANHYPLLKKAIEKGDIVSVIAEKPKIAQRGRYPLGF